MDDLLDAADQEPLDVEVEAERQDCQDCARCKEYGYYLHYNSPSVGGCISSSSSAMVMYAMNMLIWLSRSRHFSAEIMRTTSSPSSDHTLAVYLSAIADLQILTNPATSSMASSKPSMTSCQSRAT